MSKELYLGEVYNWQVTGNFGGMLYNLLDKKSLSESVNGMLGIHALPIIEKAIYRLEKYPERYRRFQISYNWGNLDQLLFHLKEFREKIIDNPYETIEA